MNSASVPDRIGGAAVIQHKKTGQTYSIRADEVDWQPPIELDPRETGHVRLYPGRIRHPDLGSMGWDIMETVDGRLQFNFSVIESFWVGSEEDIPGLVQHKVLDHFKVNTDFYSERSEARKVDIEEMLGWFHKHYRNLVESGTYENAKPDNPSLGSVFAAGVALERNFINTPKDLIAEAAADIESSGFYEWILRDSGGDAAGSALQNRPWAPHRFQIALKVPPSSWTRRRSQGISFTQMS